MLDLNSFMNLKIYESKDLVFDYARFEVKSMFYSPGKGFDMINLSIFFKTHKFLCPRCQKRYTSINGNGNMQTTTYIYIKLTESQNIY